MKQLIRRVSLRSFLLCACSLLSIALVSSCVAQNKKVTQTAGVDNTRMGAYRALARLSFQAFQKGDNATAAELARVLERAWDQGEWHNSSEGSFCKANRAVCQPIDEAMDVFIKPMLNYSKKPPIPAVVQAAFNDFLEKLTKAD
jgi:hypothetical protein